MKTFDFVAIGDITVDAFIRLKDARVHCDLKEERCELCVRFGDKIPYEFVVEVPAVGNSANASVAAARLGLSTALVTALGRDENGKKCLSALKKEGVSTKYVDQQRGIETNYHYVLWYEDERTIFVKHHEYKRTLPSGIAPTCVYLSSLGGDTLLFHDDIAKFLYDQKNILFAFQPGTFQLSLGFEKLSPLFKRADIFFCNKGEAMGLLHTVNSDMKDLLRGISERGPKKVVVTDGPKGAYAYDGERFLFVPPYPDPKPPLQRTGAGDAFASTVTAALTLGKTFEEALMWGPINSAYVVQEIGAQRGLLTRERLEKLLATAPKNYRSENF